MTLSIKKETCVINEWDGTNDQKNPHSLILHEKAITIMEDINFLVYYNRLSLYFIYMEKLIQIVCCLVLTYTKNN